MRETTLIDNLMNYSVAYHDSILEAITRRDPDAAADYMDKHLKKVEEALRTAGLKRG